MSGLLRKGILIFGLTGFLLAGEKAGAQTGLADARVRGLCGISAPLSGSPAAFLWNPANLASLRQPAFGMNLDRVFAYNLAAISDYRPPFGAVGAAAARGSLSGRPADYLGFGWARTTGRGFAWGAAAIFSQQGQERRGEAALGLRVKPAVLAGKAASSRLTLFSSVTGLGRGRNARLRLASRWFFLQQRVTWFSEWEISRRESFLRNGLELFLTPFLVARAGIRDLDWKSAGWGIGIYFRNIRLDLAYNRDEKRLQVTHVILFGDPPGQRAEHYYRQGLSLLKKREFLKAQEKFRYALFYRPDDSEYRLVLQKVRHFIEARRSQERELERQALNLENRGRFLAAYLKYHDLAEEFPRNQTAPVKMQMLQSLARYELNLVKGKLGEFFQKGEYLTLRKMLDRISTVSPQDTTLQRYSRLVDRKLRELGEKHYYTGLGYLSQKRFRDAERELQQAARYDPALPRVQEYLGAVRKQLVRIAAQTDSLKKRAQLAERRAEYARAARLYLSILQLDPADSASKAALKRLNPLIQARIEDLLNRAGKALKSDRLALAEELARQAVRLSGGQKQARQMLKQIAVRKKKRAAEWALEGRQALQAGHTQQAVTLFRRALKYDPDNKALADQMKKARLRLDREQRWLQAQAAFEANDFDQAERIVVDLLAERPDRKEYRDFLQKIRVSKSRYVTFLLQNGIHLYSQEKYAEAIRTFDRLLAVDPANQTAREYKKRTEEKIRALERLK